MIKRKSYMAKEVTHEEYFGQFVNPHLMDLLKSYCSKKELKILMEDDSENLSALTCRDFWDSLPMTNGMARELRKVGDGATIAVVVCVWKAVARELKKQNEKSKT